MFVKNALLMVGKKPPLREKLQMLDQPLIVASDADESDRPVQDAWCCEFSAIDEHVNVKGLLSGTSRFSGSAYIKFLGSSITDGPLIQGLAGIGVSGGKLYLYTSSLTHSLPLVMETWYKIEWDFAGSNVNIAIDGEWEYHQATGIILTPTTNQLIIGSGNGSTNFPKFRLAGLDCPSHTVKLNLGDKSGTIAFNNAVGGNHGTLLNGVTRVIDNTMPAEADKNNLDGFTIGASGELIPAVDKTTDALGNPLQYSGNVYPVRPVKRNSYCGVFDGVDDYVELVGLTGTETVVSHKGTATPTIVSGRIDFTAGDCYDLLLSNGWKFNFSEGVGDTIYDISGNDHHATVMNADTGVEGQGFWGGRQDEYHANLENGFSVGTGGLRVPAINSTTDALGNPLTNPAIKNAHNNAETNGDPENITVTGQATPASKGLTNPLTFNLLDSDLHLGTNEREFARNVSPERADRYLGYQDKLANPSLPIKYTTG